MPRIVILRILSGLSDNNLGGIGFLGPKTGLLFIASKGNKEEIIHDKNFMVKYLSEKLVQYLSSSNMVG